jgi:hypothetical protein
MGGLRMLKSPTPTFLYTTVFASGLTIAAKAKWGRSRQWEDAFSQLQEALDRPPRITKRSEGPVVTTPRPVDHTALDEPRVAPRDAAVHTWEELRFDSHLPGAQAPPWPANTGRDLVPHNLPPQSLWAPDVLRWTAIRRRHTQKKLAMQELATGFLIQNLLRHADITRFLHSTRNVLDHLAPQIRLIISSSDTATEAARTAFLADMERLHVTDVNSSIECIAGTRVDVPQSSVPRYRQDVDGDFYEICKQMNHGITQLLRQREKGDHRGMALVIAKICHNLLVSTAAPDLHTFNTLIAGFTMWRRPDLVDDVIAAFFASKIRPNELVCVQILDHYSLQSRADDFTRFVAKMRGVGDALSLANPAITVNEASEERLVRVNVNKVYQKTHPTPMVFAALITGVMKFAGFDRALDVYYEMKADGWGLAIPALIRLLADCINRVDWEGGSYVWEEINSIKSKVRPSYVAKAYQHMLSLCSVTGNTVAFNQVLNEVAKRGFDQRSIINAAMRTTHSARYKEGSQAPAWVADNLMIAVSGYMKDAAPSSITSDDPPPGEPDLEDVSLSSLTAEDTSEHTKPNPVDTKEAWSSWIEHELGESPKKP